MPKPLPMIEYKEFSLNVHTHAAHTNTIVNAQIELTYGCNLHCVHCYTDCYNRPDLIKRELSYAEVTRILDQLAAEGCLWVCFTGGEIFMRKDFLDIYAYAKQKGFLITLFTNGTLFTEALADYLRNIHHSASKSVATPPRRRPSTGSRRSKAPFNGSSRGFD